MNGTREIIAIRKFKTLIDKYPFATIVIIIIMILFFIKTDIFVYVIIPLLILLFVGIHYDKISEFRFSGYEIKFKGDNLEKKAVVKNYNEDIKNKILPSGIPPSGMSILTPTLEEKEYSTKIPLGYKLTNVPTSITTNCVKGSYEGINTNYSFDKELKSINVTMDAPNGFKNTAYIFYWNIVGN